MNNKPNHCPACNSGGGIMSNLNPRDLAHTPQIEALDRLLKASNCFGSGRPAVKSARKVFRDAKGRFAYRIDIDTGNFFGADLMSKGLEANRSSL